VDKTIKVGRVYNWLDQGPALILDECDVEAVAQTPEEYQKDGPSFEKGWVISLLQTGELLTVHEETLNLGEEED
tara:strand:- start:2625 stop:2846 length:222 start_codon:yes stop_codon:yes gene_type:complete